MPQPNPNPIPESLRGAAKQFHGHVPTEDEILHINSLGKGLRLLGQRRVPFTTKLAEEFLLIKELPGDRKLSDAHVSKLIQLMMEGSFHCELVNLASAFCLETGEEVRANGQHCCWARLAAPAGIETALGNVTVSRYEAQTLVDVRLLWGVFDQFRIRKRGDVIYNHLVDSAGFENSGRRIIGELSSGLSLWLWETQHERGRHDASAVAYLMQTEYATVTRKVSEFLVASPFHSARHLFRSPVVAAMFATFSKAVGKSEEFWAAVRDGANLPAGDPRLVLRNDLMRTSLSSYNKASKSKAASQEDMYRWGIHAWNAWRRGSTMIYLRSPAGVPRPLAK